MNKKILFIFLCIPKICSALVLGIIGDSISVPIPLSPVYGYPFLLESRLGCNVRNYSVSGSKTDTLLSRAETMLQECQPDFVIIALGINDAFYQRPVELVYRDLYNGIKFLTQRNMRVFVGTVDIMKMELYSKQYSYEFTYLFDALKAEFPEVGFFPFLNDQIRIFSPDSIHPDANGHKLIAGQILKVMNAK